MKQIITIYCLHATLLLLFTGCIGTRFHIPDQQRFKTPIERFSNNEEIIIAVEGREFPVQYLTKQKIDSLAKLKKQLIFILHDPTCDAGSYEQIKKIAGVFQQHEYEYIYVSMSYEIIPKLIYTIPYNKTLYEKNIYIASNEDFGAARWQKPANVAGYLLNSKVDKKDISSLFYIIVNDSTANTEAKMYRFIEF